MPSELSQNHKYYDAIDEDYGRINVKSMKISEAGNWSWNLLEESKELDSYALVYMDDDRDPLGMFLIKISDLKNNKLPPELEKRKRKKGVAILLRGHKLLEN